MMADGAFFRSQVAAEPRKSFDFGRFISVELFRQEEPWTAAQAFLFIIIAAASCDGNIAPEESEQILSTIHRSRLFKEASGEELRNIHNVVVDRLGKRGDRALSDACTALPVEYALAAFAQAIDVVLADGGFVAAEADFLDRLMVLLNISDTDAAKIAEVMNIKNGC